MIFNTGGRPTVSSDKFNYSRLKFNSLFWFRLTAGQSESPDSERKWPGCANGYDSFIPIRSIASCKAASKTLFVLSSESSSRALSESIASNEIKSSI